MERRGHVHGDNFEIAGGGFYRVKLGVGRRRGRGARGGAGGRVLGGGGLLRVPPGDVRAGERKVGSRPPASFPACPPFELLTCCPHDDSLLLHAGNTLSSSTQRWRLWSACIRTSCSAGMCLSKSLCLRSMLHIVCNCSTGLWPPSDRWCAQGAAADPPYRGRARLALRRHRRDAPRPRD
jgi:hypothetical protein